MKDRDLMTSFPATHGTCEMYSLGFVALFKKGTGKTKTYTGIIWHFLLHLLLLKNQFMVDINKNPYRI